MNVNLSQCLRAVSSLFVIFTLLFGSSMAQAKIFPRVQSLFNISDSKIEEVFDVFKDLGMRVSSDGEITVRTMQGNTSIEPSRPLSRYEIRTMVAALDHPIHLIKLSSDGLFRSDLSRAFFFNQFHLYKHGDDLFNKLFFKRNRGKWEELPFLEARENLENFLDIVRVADQEGYTRITETDLEAAAITFIFQRLSDSSVSVYSKPNSWDEQSLSTFFRDKFTVNHYTNPYFELTLFQRDPYTHIANRSLGISISQSAELTSLHQNPHYHLIGNKVLSFLKKGFFSPPELMNPKEFVLKIWKDLIEETMAVTPRGFAVRLEESTAWRIFADRIAKAIVECNRSRFPMESDRFLRAIMEAAKEDNRLAEVPDFLDSEFIYDFSRVDDVSYPAKVLENVRSAVIKAAFRDR